MRLPSLRSRHQPNMKQLLKIWQHSPCLYATMAATVATPQEDHNKKAHTIYHPACFSRMFCWLAWDRCDSNLLECEGRLSNC